MIMNYILILQYLEFDISNNIKMHAIDFSF